MKRKINLHPTKVFAYIYPVYAKEFIFGSSFYEFKKLIQNDFVFTPEQLEAIFSEWEFKEMILTEYQN
jgi:hypothetical protein